MQDLILGIKGEVEAGNNLGDSLAKYPLHFDDLYVNLVRLDQSAEEAASAVLKWMDIVQAASPGCVMAVVGSCIDLCEENPEQKTTSIMDVVKKVSKAAADEVARELQDLEDEIMDKLKGQVKRRWRELKESLLQVLNWKSASCVDRIVLCCRVVGS